MKKKIVFITPSFGRTGSEMVLWHLLNNLDLKQFEVYLFCLNKGELFDSVPPGISKTISYKGSNSLVKKVFRGLLKVFGIEPIGYQLKKINKKFKADLWYVNTLLIPQAPVAAKKQGVKVATHIHELLFAFSFIKQQEFNDIISFSDTIVGCSTIVCEKITELGKQQVKLQNSFIDEKTIHPDQEKIAKLRENFGLNVDDFVWVISGTVAYMKGLADMLSILGHFKDKSVKLIWIGGLQDNGLVHYIQQVVANSYPGRLIFTDAVDDDYYEYLSLGNCLLIPSLEESFSLVMLEAATLGMPILSFDVGIAKSFIKEGMGRVVKNHNIGDMIQAMEEMQFHLSYDEEKLKAAAEEYTVAKQVPRFEKLLMEI